MLEAHRVETKLLRQYLWKEVQREANHTQEALEQQSPCSDMA